MCLMETMSISMGGKLVPCKPATTVGASAPSPTGQTIRLVGFDPAAPGQDSSVTAVFTILNVAAIDAQIALWKRKRDAARTDIERAAADGNLNALLTVLGIHGLPIKAAA